MFNRTEGVQYTAATSIEEVALGAEYISRDVQSFGPSLRFAIAHQLLKVIGRWQGLPWWQCRGDPLNALPDKVVKRHYEAKWDRLTAEHGISAGYGWIQELLVYNGHPVDKTDQLDHPTRRALDRFLQTRGKRFLEHNLREALWELIQAVPSQTDETIRRAQRWEQGVAQKAK
ncbi:MAG: hypothetical protein ACRERU_18850 [Methylococcales bacterium]